MNADVKKLWVDALRSGQYQQAPGRLRRDDAFCCLGVLCDIYLNHTGHGRWLELSKFLIEGVQFIGALPHKVKAWADLSTTNPSTSAGDLIHLNDSGRSFLEIADIIEREL